MSKIAICADIHGREFWKIIKEHKDDFDKIVFLGDYLAPYPHEDITNKKAIEVFEEVIDFKKENPDKVILLFGNHDGSYLTKDICECRTDHRNWNLINNIFTENIKLFDLAWEITVNDKRYFFSHAGVRKEWFDIYVKDKWFAWNSETLPPAGYFNYAFHTAYDNDDNLEKKIKIFLGLKVYSRYRGWTFDNNGSIIWADIREFFSGEKSEYDDVYFVVGHTQLQNKPIIDENIACLDVRRPFVFDTETEKIEEYEK